MKNYYLYLIALFSFILWGCKQETPILDYTKQLQIEVDTTWHSYVKKLPNAQGGLGVYIVCPRGTFFLSSGLEEGASADSRFRAASITKSFTATAIMLLDQQGKLHIEDTLTNLMPGTNQPYLPDESAYQIPFKNKITIQNLLEHRANIFDQVNSPVPVNVNDWYSGQIYYLAILTQKNRYHDFTLDELHLLISKHQLTYGLPGIEHRYSNNGYTLLAKIIERVSGKSYHEFVSKEILVKNKLNRTTLPNLGNDTIMTEPYLKGYLYQNKASEDFTMFNMSWAIAEGNMVSSFRDLATFYRNLIIGDAGISVAQVKRMKTCSTTNDLYGLGIEYNEGLGYGHTGSQFGYQTIAAYDLRTDFAVISVSTLYPQDPQLNKAQGKMISDLLKRLKKIMGL
jgi:D-alanyl-D-alanine carboxypeptidase